MCGEHLQELYTVYLTRFRSYKIALPTQTKEERGPPADKHLPPNPLTGQLGLPLGFAVFVAIWSRPPLHFLAYP